MDDKKLDYLLGELFEEDIQVDMRLVYATKNKVRERESIKEQKKAWYPFILVILMNILLVLIEVGCMLFLVDTLKQASMIITIGLGLMQVPVVAYLIGQIYYKENHKLK